MVITTQHRRAIDCILYLRHKSVYINKEKNCLSCTTLTRGLLNNILLSDHYSDDKLVRPGPWLASKRPETGKDQGSSMLISHCHQNHCAAPTPRQDVCATAASFKIIPSGLEFRNLHCSREAVSFFIERMPWYKNPAVTSLKCQ